MLGKIEDLELDIVDRALDLGPPHLVRDCRHLEVGEALLPFPSKFGEALIQLIVLVGKLTWSTLFESWFIIPSCRGK